jgi:hypothetical protein
MLISHHKKIDTYIKNQKNITKSSNEIQKRRIKNSWWTTDILKKETKLYASFSIILKHNVTNC